MSTNIPKIAARFESSLANNILVGVTSLLLSSATDRYGNALSGVYGFVIDEGQSIEEFFMATVSGTTLSGIGSNPISVHESLYLNGRGVPRLPARENAKS